MNGRKRRLARARPECVRSSVVTTRINVSETEAPDQRQAANRKLLPPTQPTPSLMPHPPNPSHDVPFSSIMARRFLPVSQPKPFRRYVAGVLGIIASKAILTFSLSLTPSLVLMRLMF